VKRLVSLFCVLAAASYADSSGIQIESARRVESAREKQLRSASQQVSVRAGDFFASPWLNSPRAAETATTASVSYTACDPLPEAELATLISEAAQRENVKPSLLRAMIRRESGGRPCAISEKGAQGLMQLMPATQQTLNVTAPFDPAESVRGGASYIADLLKRYNGDTRRALAAYNAGPQRVDATGPLPDFPETKAYVEAIMGDLQPDAIQ
jgi:soluble lytic murein transglycosylase-like protein